MIRIPGDHIPQKIGIDWVLVGVLTQIWFWVDRLNAHLPHEPLHSFVIDHILLIDKLGCHPADAVVRQLGVDLIDFLHQLMIFRIYGNRVGSIRLRVKYPTSLPER